jgi:hypothetical protein
MTDALGFEMIPKDNKAVVPFIMVQCAGLQITALPFIMVSGVHLVSAIYHGAVHWIANYSAAFYNGIRCPLGMS